MPAQTDNRVKLSLELEKKRKISVPQAAEFINVSEDTFRRHYGHLIEKVSPRRDAVTVGKLVDE